MRKCEESGQSLWEYVGVEREEVERGGSIEPLEKSCVCASSRLMHNCSICKSSIVASGRIVTKRLPHG